MIRYYLCDIHLVGDTNVPAIITVEDSGLNYRTYTAADNRGALVLFAHNDHSLFANLPGVYLIPDMPLDAKISTVNSTTLGQFKEKMDQYGINYSDIADQKPFKWLLERIANTFSGVENANMDLWTISDV